MVDALAKPESEKSLPKFITDEYNEFEMYLKRLIYSMRKWDFNNEFYKMCMSKLHQKHNNHLTLKMEMDEMGVKEADLVKRIVFLEKNNTLEENFHYEQKKWDIRTHEYTYCRSLED